MVCKSLEKPKQKHKKGLWSPDEDLKLKNYVLKHGHGCWTSVPINAGLQRNGKSCRLRWINYLRPGLKRGVFSNEEEETILSLHAMLGNKWSQIALKLPGRTDNEVKNHWHSYLKKKGAKTGQMNEEAPVKAETSTSSLNYLESSPSSAKSNTYTNTNTPQNSTIESAEHLEASLMSDTEQSLSQAHHMDCKTNLPKVLFAEWFSLDQFRDQMINCDNSENGNPLAACRDFEYYNSYFQDAFMHDLLFQGGTFTGGGIHQGPINGSSAAAEMLQPPLKFEDHISENGFVGFINGQFNITTDGLFL